MEAATFLKCSCPHCDGHVEYPAEAGGRAISCPHCQSPWVLPAPRSTPRKTSPRTSAGILVLAFLVIGVGVAAVVHRMGPNTPTTGEFTPAAGRTNLAKVKASAPSGTKASKSPDDLKTGTIKLEGKPGSSLVYATGTLKNNSEHQRFGVKIELDLFNAQNEKVGTATDYTQVIEPRETWSFRALVNEIKVTSAKVARVSELD